MPEEIKSESEEIQNAGSAQMEAAADTSISDNPDGNDNPDVTEVIQPIEEEASDEEIPEAGEDPVQLEDGTDTNVETIDDGDEEALAEEQVPAAVAQEAAGAKAEKREIIIRNCKFKCITGLIDMAISAKEEDKVFIEQKAVEALAQELTTSSTNPEEAKKLAAERVAEAEKYLSTLEIKGENIELSPVEIIQIKRNIVEPILHGHVKGITMTGLAGKVVVAESETFKTKYLEDRGYKGRLSTDTQGTIFISREALDPGFRTPEGSKLNLRHLITHESAHTVVEDVIQATPETPEQIENRNKMLNFAQEVLATAETAKEKRIPQPKHVEAMLEFVANAENDFNQADPPINGTLENFKSERKKIAAKEILTDYSAIYMHSDGSFPQFAFEVLYLVNDKSLINYLKSNGQENATEKEVNEKLSELSEAPEGQRTAYLEKFPPMAQAFEFYRKAFDIAHANISDANLKRCAQARAEQGDLESGDFGEHYDPISNFSDQKNPQGEDHNQESMTNCAKGLFMAMANEVDIMSSYETPA